MTDEEMEGGSEVAARTVVLFLPILLPARLLGLLVPKPLAWAGSMLAWLLAIYWLPSRTAMSLRRWLIIVFASATVTFLVALVQPDLF